MSTTKGTDKSANESSNGDGMCPAPGCSDKANKLMPKCELCQQFHCIKHHIPEVHGCRDAAKNQARMDASKDAIKVREAKKDHDRTELKAKLEARKQQVAKTSGRSKR